MRVTRLASTPSTQEVARRLPIGSAVMTDHQTAGRGRLGRAWEAAPGSALLASLVVPFGPLVSIAAGVAVAEAVRTVRPDLEPRLKWPNDVLLDGAKLAGILVEVSGERAIVGIGVNLTDAPPDAAKLGPVDRERLLQEIGRRLEHWLAGAPGSILQAWRDSSDTIGRLVRVELPNESFDGVAEDILDDGSLAVGGRAVSAGDVVHIRPAG